MPREECLALLLSAYKVIAKAYRFCSLDLPVVMSFECEVREQVTPASPECHRLRSLPAFIQILWIALCLCIKMTEYKFRDVFELVYLTQTHTHTQTD